jgi:hypothetical protein
VLLVKRGRACRMVEGLRISGNKKPRRSEVRETK